MKFNRRSLLVGGIVTSVGLGGFLVANRSVPFVSGDPVQFFIDPHPDRFQSLSSPIGSRNALSRLCNVSSLSAADVMHFARFLKTAEWCGFAFPGLSSIELCEIFLDDSKLMSYFGVQSGIFVPRGAYFEVKRRALVSPFSDVSEAHQDYLLFTMAECGIHLDSIANICRRTSEKPLRLRFDRITSDIERALDCDDFSLTVSSLLLYYGAGSVDLELIAGRIIRSKEQFCYDLHRFYAIAALVQMKRLPATIQSNLEIELELKSRIMLDSQMEDGAWRNNDGLDSLVITSHQVEWWYLLLGKSREVEAAIDRATTYLAIKLQRATAEELKKHFATWCHVARCLLINDWRRGYVHR